ncbi:MAG: hypothetical protein HZC14_02730 [Candidatus Niyogibacteria bacterium]|nr:hypothetical protein [Candidatus Niyogibacteria bacterium]
MLAERINKFKTALEERKNDLFTAAAIVLIAIIGFGLGRLSAIYERKTPVTVEYLNDTGTTTNAMTSNKDENTGFSVNNTGIVASKNGSKYYPADCPAAARIKEENKIRFNSAKEAEAAGYSASVMCQ